MKKYYPLSVCFLIFVFAVISACSKDDPKYIAEQDRKIILQYIEDNNLDAHEVDDTGVFYVIEKEGSGDFPSSNSRVHVASMGFFLDDDEEIVFKEYTSQYYNLNEQILGWQYGIPKFNRGAKGMLLIPSAHGYGPDYNYWYTGVPPNTVLFYEIEMIDFS